MIQPGQRLSGSDPAQMLQNEHGTFLVQSPTGTQFYAYCLENHSIVSLQEAVYVEDKPEGYQILPTGVGQGQQQQGQQGQGQQGQQQQGQGLWQAEKITTTIPLSALQGVQPSKHASGGFQQPGQSQAFVTGSLRR